MTQSKKSVCRDALADLEKAQVSTSDSEMGELSDCDSQGFGMDVAAGDDNHLGMELFPEPEVFVNTEEEEDDAQLRSLALDLEQTWEPQRQHSVLVPANDSDNDDHDELPDALTADAMIEAYRQVARRADEDPRIVSYSSRHPRSRPGKIIRHDAPRDAAYQTFVSGGSNVWAPFISEVDWKVAKWAKLRGTGSTAFSELLAIDGVRENGYHSIQHVFNNPLYAATRCFRPVVQEYKRVERHH